MTMTKRYAKILAGLLTEQQVKAFRVVCGKDDNVSDIPEAVINELVSLELIVRRVDLLKGGELAILTSRGRKVAAFI